MRTFQLNRPGWLDMAVMCGACNYGETCYNDSWDIFSNIKLAIQQEIYKDTDWLLL